MEIKASKDFSEQVLINWLGAVRPFELNPGKES